MGDHKHRTATHRQRRRPHDTTTTMTTIPTQQPPGSPHLRPQPNPPNHRLSRAHNFSIISFHTLSERTPRRSDRSRTENDPIALLPSSFIVVVSWGMGGGRGRHCRRCRCRRRRHWTNIFDIAGGCARVRCQQDQQDGWDWWQFMRVHARTARREHVQPNIHIHIYLIYTCSLHMPHARTLLQGVRYLQMKYYARICVH